MVLPAMKDAAGNQAVEPIGQDVRRDREFSQDLVVATVAKKALSNNHEAPFVADDFRARAKPNLGGRARTGFRRKDAWCCGRVWQGIAPHRDRRGISHHGRRQLRRNGST